MKLSSARRNLLKSAIMLPFGFAAGLTCERRADATVASNRNAKSYLKTSINAYCFDPLLRENLKDPKVGMSLFDVLAFCAEHNVDAIDPTGYYFPGYPEVPRDKYLNEFKRRAFELGVDISGTGIKNDFATPDASARAKDIQLAKQWIEAAARLGAPVLRVFAGAVPPQPYSWDDGAKWMSDALNECVEHGEKYGVIVGLQNHGDMLKTADECLKVLSMVKSPWIGLILDTGNFLTANPYDDIARVISVTVNWQIKELLQSNKGDKTDLHKLVRIIREGGYRGYIPIETLKRAGQPYDPRARTTELLGDLRAALA
jgi:sugar phosphate isomerase/epimerase